MAMWSRICWHDSRRADRGKRFGAILLACALQATPQEPPRLIPPDGSFHVIESDTRPLIIAFAANRDALYFLIRTSAQGTGLVRTSLDGANREVTPLSVSRLEQIHVSGNESIALVGDRNEGTSVHFFKDPRSPIRTASVPTGIVDCSFLGERLVCMDGLQLFTLLPEDERSDSAIPEMLHYLEWSPVFMAPIKGSGEVALLSPMTSEFLLVNLGDRSKRGPKRLFAPELQQIARDETAAQFRSMAVSPDGRICLTPLNNPPKYGLPVLCFDLDGTLVSRINIDPPITRRGSRMFPSFIAILDKTLYLVDQGTGLVAYYPFD
jgi:hypothetical protein